MARSRRGEVHTITGARVGVSDDVSTRTRRYLISMGIRTVCVILAVVFTGWLRWIFAAGAILLPYISVVLANSGRERIETMPVVDGYEQRPALEPGPAPAPQPGPASTPGPGPAATPGPGPAAAPGPGPAAAPGPGPAPASAPTRPPGEPAAPDV